MAQLEKDFQTTRGEPLDDGFDSCRGRGSDLSDLELAKFQSSQTKDPALQKSVAELDKKLQLLEDRLQKINELFIQFIHKRLSFAEDGVNIEEEIAKLSLSDLPNLNGGKIFIRKLIKAFRDHFLHANSEERIREIFQKDLR